MEKTRVLFIAEAAHAARPGWLLALARALDPARFSPLLAWHPRFNDALGPLEFPFYPIPGLEPAEYFRRLTGLRPIYDVDTLERYVAWELEVYREAAPWIVVSDARPSVSTSAAAARLPHVKVVSAHWSPYAGGPFHISELPAARWVGQALARSAFHLLWPFLSARYNRALKEVSRRFGGPTVEDPRAVYAGGDWTVYPDVPEITPTENLPATHRYIGPAVWSPEVPAPPLPPDDGRPLVYVDLSPQPSPETLGRVIQALQAAPVRAVMATGGWRPPAPGNVVCVDALPGPAKIPGVAAVVCAGGVGTVIPGLAAGLPVVGVAGNIDQFLYMNHVERAGLGLMVRAGAAASDLGAALARVLKEPDFTAYAKAMAARFRAMDTGSALGGVIDEVLKARPHAARPAPPRPVTEGPAGRAFTPEEARRLVEAAVWAPSAGNSQPLRYRLTGGRLAVHVDPFCNNRFMDVANSDMWTTLGAALVNMRAAAAAGLGAGVRVDLFPEGARDGLLALASLAGEPSEEGALAEAVPGRCTNRRPYKPEPLAGDLLRALGAWADLPGVKLDWRYSTPDVEALADTLSTFERILFMNGNIGRCVLQWVRPGTPAGFDPRCLELGTVERLLFSAAKNARFRSLISRVISQKAFVSSRSRLRQSGAFGFLSVEGVDSAAMVRSGMAFQRLWLAAHQKGVAIHPMVGMVLLNFRMRFAGGQGLSRLEREWAEEGLERLRGLVPAFGDRVPVVIFRAGFAEAPSCRAWRLPLSEVFSTGA